MGLAVRGRQTVKDVTRALRQLANTSSQVLDSSTILWRSGGAIEDQGRGNDFYRAMHYSAKRGIGIACRPSVCL